MSLVKFNLYASLRSYSAGKPSIEVDVEPGRTVGQVLADLGIPEAHTRIVFVNNRSSSLSQPLEGGERVGVFPAIGGG
jgi:molybdopterin converting factor small subunit